MVEIQITGVRYDVSEKVKRHVEEKLGGLDRYHPDLKNLRITIHEAPNFGFRVDVDIHLPKHKDVVAHEEERTIYSAIDLVADKCRAQLSKLHDKAVRRSSDRQCIAI